MNGSWRLLNRLRRVVSWSGELEMPDLDHRNDQFVSVHVKGDGSMDLDLSGRSWPLEPDQESARLPPGRYHVTVSLRRD